MCLKEKKGRKERKKTTTDDSIPLTTFCSPIQRERVNLMVMTPMSSFKPLFRPAAAAGAGRARDGRRREEEEEEKNVQEGSLLRLHFGD